MLLIQKDKRRLEVILAHILQIEREIKEKGGDVENRWGEREEGRRLVSTATH